MSSRALASLEDFLVDSARPAWTAYTLRGALKWPHYLMIRWDPPQILKLYIEVQVLVSLMMHHVFKYLTPQKMDQVLYFFSQKLYLCCPQRFADARHHATCEHPAVSE